MSEPLPFGDDWFDFEDWGFPAPDGAGNDPPDEGPSPMPGEEPEDLPPPSGEFGPGLPGYLSCDVPLWCPGLEYGPKPSLN